MALPLSQKAAAIREMIRNTSAQANIPQRSCLLRSVILILYPFHDLLSLTLLPGRKPFFILSALLPRNHCTISTVFPNGKIPLLEQAELAHYASLRRFW